MLHNSLQPIGRLVKNPNIPSSTSNNTLTGDRVLAHFAKAL